MKNLALLALLSAHAACQVSLKFAEDYIKECVMAAKKDPFCSEISESTKDNLSDLHKNRHYVRAIDMLIELELEGSFEVTKAGLGERCELF